MIKVKKLYEEYIKFYKIFGKKTILLSILTIFSGLLVPIIYIFIASKYTEKIRASFISTEHLNNDFIKCLLEFIICFAIMNSLHLLNFFSVSKFMESIYYRLTDVMFRRIYNYNDNFNKEDLISSGLKTIRNILLIVRLFIIFWINVIFDVLLINFYVYLHDKKIGAILLMLYLSDAILIYILSIINIRKQRLLDQSEDKYDVFIRDVLSKSETNSIYNLSDIHINISREITKQNAKLYGRILFIQLVYEIFIAIYNVICVSTIFYLIIKNSNISSLNKSAIFAMLISNLADLWRLTKNIVTFVDTWSAIKFDIFFLKNIYYEKIDINSSIDIILNNNNVSFVKGINIISGNSGSGKSLLIKSIIQKYNNVIAMHQIDHIYNDTLLKNIILSEEYDEKIFQKVINIFKNPRFNKSINLNIKNTLSGGEIKMLCFMRLIYYLLISEKRKSPYSAIILDEPFNHIDQNNIKIISEYIKNILLKKYIVILVDHGNYLNESAIKIFYI